jgi:hypothetical protein
VAVWAPLFDPTASLGNPNDAGLRVRVAPDACDRVS